VFCKNDAAFLCGDCNTAAHNNPLAARHTIVSAAEAMESEAAASVPDSSSNTTEKPHQQQQVPAGKLDKEALTKTVFGKDLEVSSRLAGCSSIVRLLFRHWNAVFFVRSWYATGSMVRNAVAVTCSACCQCAVYVTATAGCAASLQLPLLFLLVSFSHLLKHNSHLCSLLLFVCSSGL
jgi:hypothetical protein